MGFATENLTKQWQYEKIREYFINEYDTPQAQTSVLLYKNLRQLKTKNPLSTITNKVRFSGVSLFRTSDQKTHKPTPVIHSDDGFALLMLNPSLKTLEEIIDTTFRPFPAGLYTPVGITVANPCYASLAFHNIKQLETDDQYWKYNMVKNFNENEYHGTVMWSWQHAVLAAGLEKQLQRPDLTTTTKSKLQDAQAKLSSIMHDTRDLDNSEWWSFNVEETDVTVKDQHSSNPAQLWSTVFLALPEPQYDVPGKTPEPDEL